MLVPNAVAAIALLLAVVLIQANLGETKKKENRNGRLLSLFQVVQFPNAICAGSGGKNGTCYTADECTSKQGTNSGSCASGYGVCCTFTLRCSSTTNQNCTYFESAGTEGTGACTATVCRTSGSICQLRLDFNTFIIHGPTTISMSTGNLLNGVPVATGGKVVNRASQCITDTFFVSNPGGSQPSPICGTNTGEHLYVDASASCNALTFQFGATPATGTPAVARSWRIKVTQFSCSFPNRAPAGCNQYFFGASTGSVRSFNFNSGNGHHLASQDQTICIRQERGFCRICWSAAIANDFKLSGKMVKMAAASPTECCNYGDNGNKDTLGYECVIIPGARADAAIVMNTPPAICGRTVGLVTAATAGKVAKTVCSVQQPFQLRFRSDAFEYNDETMASADQRGFQLAYIQSTTNCPTPTTG